MPRQHHKLYRPFIIGGFLLGLALFPAGIPAVFGLGDTSPTLQQPQSPSAPLHNQAPEPLLRLPDAPSSAVLETLNRIEARHGNLKTLTAEFEQSKVSQMFDQETRSTGRLDLQMPGRLRCEYSQPEKSIILFTDATFYQYVPSIKQVDKFVYRSSEEARERFNLTLLGFGVSSKEVLKSYQVETTSSLASSPRPFPGIVFKPLREDLAKIYSHITVWFDPERLLPHKVRIAEVSEDLTTLTIQSISLDIPMSEDKFKPDFPKDSEVIEH